MAGVTICKLGLVLSWVRIPALPGKDGLNHFTLQLLLNFDCLKLLLLVN